LKKNNWLGIIGGLLVFLFILSYTIYLNSNFDQQLINDVDNGVPANKLLPKIDKETDKDELKIKERINSHIMSTKMWGNGSLAVKDDYSQYELIYYNQVKAVLEHEKVREQFAKREISKEQFLIEIKEYNDDLERLAM